MATESHAVRGVVHGKTIELNEGTGLPDGQPVTVTVQPIANGGRQLPPGEGIRRSAGAWADDSEELDEFLRWNRQQRKVRRSPIED